MSPGIGLRQTRHADWVGVVWLGGFTLTGCETPATSPAPWDDLPLVPPEPMRELLRVRPGDSPIWLGVAETTTWSADAGQLRVLDSRYRYDTRAGCLPLERWDNVVDDPGRRGSCAAGEVSVQRGLHKVDAGISGITAAGSRIWVVDGNGLLFRLDVDPMIEDPLDLGRLLPHVQLSGSPPARGTLLVTDTEVVVVEPARIRRWSLDGISFADEELPARARGAALVEGAPWVLTDSGIIVEGSFLTIEPSTGALSEAAIVADGQDGAWVSGADSLWHVDATGGTERVAVFGATGPLATWDGRVYAAAGDQLLRFEAVEGAWSETARVEVGARIRHLAAGAPGELRVGLDDGTVSVRVDEDRLWGSRPLHVWVTGPIENPKAAGARMPCQGGPPDGLCPETVDAQLDVVSKNLDFLRDLPAPTLIPLTAAAAEAFLDCGRGGELRDLLQAPHVEAGLFLHEVPEDCRDSACYRDFLEEQLSPLLLLDVMSPMITGAAEHTRVGLDWTETYPLLGLPSRFPMFAMSLWPQIPKNDPRKKDPFTAGGLTPSRAWRVGDAYGDVGTDEPLGGVTMLPGDNIPGYFLGDCPNLTVDECNVLERGGGATFDAKDLAVLTLLVTRALAQRSEEGTYTWSFHLPAIERLAYTEDCTVDARRWSGAGCEAALLQDTFFDLHQRWALSGQIRWSRVSEVPTL